MKNKQKKPKILIFDVETAPIAGYVWSLWQQNVGLNQILSDWYILSWSAKWLGEPASKIMHMNQGEAKDIEDDSKILKELWKLLNEADVVVTQNGKHFDEKRLNARFIIHGIRPPAPYKHIDTCQIAKHKFGFTSSKLEYLSGKLCKKYKKYPHNKYPGFALWAACLGGDPDVWEEMRKYNNFDVLATEELYTILKPWDSSVNLAVYQDNRKPVRAVGLT